MRPRNPRNSTLNRMTATSVMVAGDRVQLEVVPRGGREVEADQRDDRAGHDRRHQRVDPAAVPTELHDEADDREQHARRPRRRRVRGAEVSRAWPVAAVIGAMNANDEPR